MDDFKKNIYEVGQIVSEFRGRPEGTHFDISDAGATLLVFFDRPDAQEIEQFKSGNRFEIRFTHLKNVIMVTVKIGNLAWMDAPYNPNLSKNLTRMFEVSEGEGLSLTLILVDARTGEIKSLRLLGLSTNFTRELSKAVSEERGKPFDKMQYNTNVNSIYAYSTKKIVSMSNSYCIIS